MIAITVSTKYHDLLPIVYHYNNDYFKHWVFVTDIKDEETIKFLSSKHNLTILYYDFKNHRNIFDKGGAIRYAQHYVYNTFPDDWYLLIDSDICLTAQFIDFKTNHLPSLDQNFIYGLNERLDFKSLSDLEKCINYTRYDHKGYVYGYFQLYKEKFYYNTSRDASHCDSDFVTNFAKSMMISGIQCAHLGSRSHWSGDRKIGSDFKL